MIYIAFEGIDGSGKTKQLSLLEDYLTRNNYSVLVTKEFGSPHNFACEKLREFALNSAYGFDELAGQFMFAACSTQHSERVISPQIDKYDFILSDRSVESNLAYCGALDHREFAHQLFFSDKRRIYPEKIIYLDVDPETSWPRISAREQEQFEGGTDRIEAKGLTFQKKVRDEYERRITENPHYIVIDCNTLDIEQTHNVIVERLMYDNKKKSY